MGKDTILSDLWAWNFAGQTWSLLSDKNSMNMMPVYGMIGVANPDNHPGGRFGHTATFDEESGIMLIFGGIRCVPSSTTMGILIVFCFQSNRAYMSSFSK